MRPERRKGGIESTERPDKLKPRLRKAGLGVVAIYEIIYDFIPVRPVGVRDGEGDLTLYS